MPKTIKKNNELYDFEITFNRSKSWTFYSSDQPLEEFIDWLIEDFDPSLEIIIFSHNGGR